MALTKPFNYGQILIGDEVVYRGLNQQQIFANDGKYGMTWNPAKDGPIKAAAMVDGSAMKSNDFDVPGSMRHCPVDPPCPWPKTSDELDAGLLMPIMMANDAGTSYNIKVAEQTGSASTVFHIGPTVADYTLNQSELAPIDQASFLYFERGQMSKYKGNAILVIEKIQNGSPVDQFTYLFDLT